MIYALVGLVLDIEILTIDHSQISIVCGVLWYTLFCLTEGYIMATYNKAYALTIRNLFFQPYNNAVVG